MKNLAIAAMLSLVPTALACAGPGGGGGPIFPADTGPADTSDVSGGDIGGADTVPVVRECVGDGTAGVTVEGVFGVGAGFTFDKATVTVEHKMDVDAFEDGCLTSLRLDLGKGFGCKLEIEAGGAIAADGGMRVRHLSLAADSQCPGFPDDSEGEYADASAMQLMVVVPEVYEVPDENAPTSCIASTLEVRLSGTLKDGGGRALTIAPTVLFIRGEMISTGSTTAQCPCAAKCDERDCGSDTCGFSCGTCGGDERCETATGQCVCQPSCGGRECGDDGCGGSCGGCAGNETCGGGHCIACQPNCTGRDCGDDGCGGSCGNCPDGDACQGGECVCQPSCGGRECGDDGCGGSCGGCGSDVCEGGQCVTPPDPCGDGVCGAGEAETCPTDCSSGFCNGVCETLDSFLCPEDCAVCGNGTCDGGETRAICPGDCAVGCGDETCSGNESATSCPYDCAVCGDAICSAGESASCPIDCFGF